MAKNGRKSKGKGRKEGRVSVAKSSVRKISRYKNRKPDRGGRVVANKTRGPKREKATKTALAELSRLFDAELAKRSKSRKAAAKKAAATRKRNKELAAELFELFKSEAELVEQFGERSEADIKTGRVEGVRKPDESRDQDVIANTGRLIQFEGVEVQLNAGADNSVFLSENENFLRFTKMAGEIINDYHRESERMQKKGKLALSPWTIWVTHFITRPDGSTDFAVIQLDDVVLVGFTQEQREKFDVNFYFFKHF